MESDSVQEDHIHSVFTQMQSASPFPLKVYNCALMHFDCRALSIMSLDMILKKLCLSLQKQLSFKDKDPNHPVVS